jgi:hypothetical protein
MRAIYLISDGEVGKFGFGTLSYYGRRLSGLKNAAAETGRSALYGARNKRTYRVRGILPGSSIPAGAPPDTWALSRQRWVWAALTPALLVAGLFAWQAFRTNSGADSSTLTLRAVPLTTLPGVVRYSSFSPDGNHVAFTWTGPSKTTLISPHSLCVIGGGQPVSSH